MPSIEIEAGVSDRDGGGTERRPGKRGIIRVHMSKQTLSMLLSAAMKSFWPRAKVEYLISVSRLVRWNIRFV